MAHSFRFLEDIAVADIAFEAEGDSALELFQAATDALLETLADPSTVAMTWERDIEHAAMGLDELLFEWLSDLVYWKDAAGVVFHDADLSVVHDGIRWKLMAVLRGAPVDQTTQTLRNDVKGVTKHLYEVTQQGVRWYAKVVVDV
ncbi:MAG: archease [Nitrospira sp.]|nr:archease [Nitrospira sp.]MDH4304421.1 archease [Nitrospira sp.]MDH5194434.1 archease [Nitrospira sp.]